MLYFAKNVKNGEEKSKKIKFLKMKRQQLKNGKVAVEMIGMGLLTIKLSSALFYLLTSL